MSKIGSRSWYSILTAAAASLAVSSSSAATQATISPICLTFSSAIACSSFVTGRTPKADGASMPVAVAKTPGIDSTSVMSIDSTFA